MQEFIEVVFTGKKTLTYIDVNLKIWQSVKHDLHMLKLQSYKVKINSTYGILASGLVDECS